MRRIYQGTGVGFLLLALFVAREALDLRYYTSLGPGPGFFPFWLALLLGALALIMICQATFAPAEPMPATLIASRTGYLRLFTVIAALIGVVVLIEPLGFRLTMLGFYLLLLTTLGRQSLVTSSLVAVVGSFGSYYVASEWLDLPLPVGNFGF